MLYCHRYIMVDVETWLNKSTVAKKDHGRMKSLIHGILNTQTSEDFDHLCSELKPQMIKEFRTYFENNLEADIREFGIVDAYEKFDAFKKRNCKRPTNNICESFNNQIKCWQERTLVRLDALTIDLLQYQIWLLSEFNRASRGLGDFKTKYEFSKTTRPLDINCSVNRYSAAEIVSNIKANGMVEDEEPNFESLERLAEDSNVT